MNEFIRNIFAGSVNTQLPAKEEKIASASSHTNPIYNACKYNHTDTLEQLLKVNPQLANKPICSPKNNCIIPPVYVAGQDGHVEIIQLLVSYQADPNAIREDTGGTALHTAAQNGHLQAVKKLHESGASLDHNNHAKITPFALALKYRQYHVTEYLLGAGAGSELPAVDRLAVDSLLKSDSWQDYFSKIDNMGSTALHTASSHGYGKTVKVLLDNGVNADLKNGKGRTPLHLAASEGCSDVAQSLLEHNADVNLQDKDGYTPLHHAAKYGHLAVVRRLRESGKIQNINAVLNPENNITALFLAAENGHPDIVDLLLEQDGIKTCIESTCKKDGTSVTLSPLEEAQCGLAQNELLCARAVKAQANVGIISHYTKKKADYIRVIQQLSGFPLREELIRKVEEVVERETVL